MTVVRGRLDHLVVQQTALNAQPTQHERVVVQMGGPDIREVIDCQDVHLLLLPDDGGPLPLAAARNAGVAVSSADAVLLLDVDCVPSPNLLSLCISALDHVGGLVAGPVGYLPAEAKQGPLTAERMAGLALPHPARPVPATGELLYEERYELFWSLSFAMLRSDWHRVGGFCEEYRGYGGEDTDFAWKAKQAGLPLHWVGGAWAWHQHHPVSDPPREHLADIVRNSRLFYRRWGSWPMSGWLEAFRLEGLLDWSPEGSRCVLTHEGRERISAP